MNGRFYCLRSHVLTRNVYNIAYAANTVPIHQLN
jgi:hypothetical protein